MKWESEFSLQLKSTGEAETQRQVDPWPLLTSQPNLINKLRGSVSRSRLDSSWGMTTKVDLWPPYTEANTYTYLHTHKCMQLHKKEKRKKKHRKGREQEEAEFTFFRQSTPETQQSIHEGNNLVTSYQVPPYSGASREIVCNAWIWEDTRTTAVEDFAMGFLSMLEPTPLPLSPLQLWLFLPTPHALLRLADTRLPTAPTIYREASLGNFSVHIKLISSFQHQQVRRVAPLNYLLWVTKQGGSRASSLNHYVKWLMLSSFL